MYKTIIFGGYGMLAQAFGRSVFPNKEISTIDITDEDAVSSIIDKDVANVINCAAYTDVDGAEINKEEAYKANVIGPKILAQQCAKTGAKLIHFSSDYVFSGDRDLYLANRYGIDSGPINYYGETKLLGEKEITKNCKNYLIIRTSGLYSFHGNNFVTKILRLARNKKEIKVVNDQWFRPTQAESLVKATLDLITTDILGTYNYTDSGYCNWYQFAKKIVFINQNYNCNIIPCTSLEFNSLAKRPRNSILDIRKTEELVGRPKHWMENLEETVKRYREYPNLNDPNLNYTLNTKADLW